MEQLRNRLISSNTRLGSYNYSGSSYQQSGLDLNSLGGDAYSAPAIWKETYSASPTTQQLFYLHRDFLGSIVLITNTDGQTVEKRQFDAWGNIVRLQDGSNNNLSNFTVIDRGFTGHEHLLPVGLIHMNARLYDPLLGRFLAPDNYIQDPYGTQNFNRYGYALNNPLVYVDPDGELLWLIPVAFFLFFTDAGYELQKYVSPVAFHVDWGLGSHERKLGFNVSWGVPRISPYSFREDYGATYYWKHISGDYTGWENRKGYEHSLLGLYHWGKTEYQAGEFSQTVGYRKVGIPSVFGVDLYNDLWGDAGDRFRTSRTAINFGLFGLDLTMFTGDPGLHRDDRYKVDRGPHGTCQKNPNDPYAPDPNAYRAGILSLRIGRISVGLDHEKIRNFFQNTLVHRTAGYPYFEDLSKNPNYRQYRRGRFFWRIGAFDRPSHPYAI